MLFNSWTFLLFCAVVYPLYYILKLRGQNALLLMASYLFYGAWDYRFLSLIIASTFVDYFLSIKIHQGNESKIQKRYLLLSCLFNLGMLGIFKYCGFFLESAHELLTLIGIQNVEVLRLNIVLPVGISFYTFQTMSYTIDVYLKKVTPIKNYLDYSLYVAFFPQLVAGPIERANQLIPQITQKRSLSKKMVYSGLWLISWGLFKKVVVADNLGIFVDQVFSKDHSPDGLECLLGVYAFAYQIYGDFSGYSDIARGLAKLMGINLMKNFNIPYFSLNPQEFWRRWHISLSTWLRDYLYISLGGNQGGTWFTYRNLILTMILGGLWHGAAWTYILWGVYQGALLVGHRLFFGKQKDSKAQSPLLHTAKLVGMFHLTCLGWLIFRASSINQIGFFLNKIFTDWSLTQTNIGLLFAIIFFAGMLWFVEFVFKNTDHPEEGKYWNKGLGAFTLTFLWLSIIIMAPPGGQSFIYFQF